MYRSGDDSRAWRRGIRRAGELKIGDAGPTFAGIIGTDDKEHSLADYKSAKLVVLVFTCNHCPVAQAFQQRLVDLQKDYQKKACKWSRST